MTLYHRKYIGLYAGRHSSGAAVYAVRCDTGILGRHVGTFAGYLPRQVFRTPLAFAGDEEPRVGLPSPVPAGIGRTDAIPVYTIHECTAWGRGRKKGLYLGRRGNDLVYGAACCARPVPGVPVLCCAAGTELPEEVCLLVQTQHCGSFWVWLRYRVAADGFLAGWYGTYDRVPLPGSFGPECLVASSVAQPALFQLYDFFLRCDTSVTPPTWRLSAGPCDLKTFLPGFAFAASAFGGGNCSSGLVVRFSVLAGLLGNVTADVYATGGQCTTPAFLCCPDMPETLYLRPAGTGLFSPRLSEPYFDYPQADVVALQRTPAVIINGINIGPGWFGTLINTGARWEFGVRECNGGQHAFGTLGYRLRVYGRDLVTGEEVLPGGGHYELTACQICDSCPPFLTYALGGPNPIQFFLTSTPGGVYTCCCPEGLPRNIFASVGGVGTIPLEFKYGRDNANHCFFTGPTGYYFTARADSRPADCFWTDIVGDCGNFGLWWGRLGNTAVAVTCEYDPCAEAVRFKVVKVNIDRTELSVFDYATPISCSPLLVQVPLIGVILTI